MDVTLLDRSFYAGDPFPALARLRAEQPVYRDPTGMWALLRYDDVVWAERHPELLSSANGSRPRAGPQPSMIDSDDPQHKRRRRLVDKGFHPRRVAEMEDHIRDITRALADAVAPRGECDLVRDLAAQLPAIVIAEMLGVRPEDRDRLIRWSDVLISGADGPENVTDEVMTTFADFAGYANEVLDERRRAARDDLISILVHAEIDGDRLSHDELIGESLLLLIGGLETTRNAISGGLDAIMRNPEQQKLLVAEPGRIPAAVEECLRWTSPVINMARTATTDVEVRGRTTPAGDQVLLVYSSANRDPEVFENPETFDATRDPNPHVAFGHAAHHCLGAALARLEIKVMLEEVLRRFPDIRLAAPEAPVVRTRSSFIHGITTLPVVFR